jgi:hypothetical protein
VNDDLQKTFKRYHAIKDGKKPGPFTPGESTKNSLINPTHVYTIANSSDTAAAPKQQPTAPPHGDLFDFMSPPKQQQMPPQ